MPGPLLFLIYINDVNSVLESMKSISFADDSNLLYKNKDINELYIEATYDLNNAIDWFRANKLSININKTSYMIFKPHCKKDNANANSIKIEKLKPQNFQDYVFIIN